MKRISKRYIKELTLCTLFLAMLSSFASAGVITEDAVWQGDVSVTGDVLVPEGVTLTVKPGTRVKIASAESTKTEPEYLSTLTEITVRGSLKVEGTDEAPVEFSAQKPETGAWAGIILDGGSAVLTGCRIVHAETGIHVLNGNLVLRTSRLTANRYGLVAQGVQARAAVEHSRITGNDYGVVALQQARISGSTAVVRENRKKDTYTAAGRQYNNKPKISVVDNTSVDPVRFYDALLIGETVWQGKIEVNGTVRVPPGSRLVILPGTIVEFRKFDSNADGIGEYGIMIQGSILAKGTPDQPIVFRSAEKVKKMGDWDSINIMNSDRARNLIEYCRIEHAYRGLHFHFSHVAVHQSVLMNNYRGIQFQESTVEIKESQLLGNKSGVRARDSDISFAGNTVADNYAGVNFLRAHVTARGNTILGNRQEGWRIREGISELHENLIDGNRFGLMAADAFYGDYSRNSISNNMETGISLKNIDNVEIAGNIVSGNGLNGLSIQDAGAVIKGNLISDNGERGIGIISFDGLITENNFSSNGSYAVGLDGRQDAAAPRNWWGGDDREKSVFDRLDDPGRGRVRHDQASEVPFAVAWPLPAVSSDFIWRGVIRANNTVTVMRGVTLTIAPSTRVEFSPAAGLAVRGRLRAEGSGSGPIVFTAAAGNTPWDEILLEHAEGSRISHCLIEHATWGVHSHFTDLLISDSRFRKNYGGLRFRSGPVAVERSVFEQNTIGIRSYRGNAVIAGNIIRNNETGIFVREKGSGLKISRNNFLNNSSYNIRVGDFNDEDVQADGNWWGTDNPAGTIFDGRAEPGIGIVLYEPFLARPVKTDWTDPQQAGEP